MEQKSFRIASKCLSHNSREKVSWTNDCSRRRRFQTKTPNEIALTILLAGFTLVFLIVCVTLKPFADYTGTVITIASFLSLFVCLIPTTIGGLLSAIGIAGMDRALRANVITKSGKAVETAGDIDTLLLDKTGTITIGNRKATHFYPANGLENHALPKFV